MGALSLARIALACAAFGLLIPPWYGLESGFASWPAGEAAPLAVLLAGGAAWWLWPVPLLLLAAAPSLLAHRAEGRLLIACGTGAIAWVFLQGWAIGLPGTVWSIAAPFVGDASQPALGWGATFLLTGAVGLLSAGLAARGRFSGDAFVSFLVVGSAALLIAFVFAPLLTILSAAAVEDGRIAPEAMLARLAAPEAWSLACVSSSLGCGVVWNTLALATLTGVLSTLLGLAFALLSARAKLHLGGAFRALAILPLITPPFVVSLSLIVLFGRTGMVTEALSALFGIPRSRWIYGLPGVLLAQLLAFTPIAYLLLEGAVRQIAPSLEEAAATMGARRFTVFRTVTWPLLRP
ncbi:MAG: ABC transporter permease, partial [Elioraea tepidiphila]